MLRNLENLDSVSTSTNSAARLNDTKHSTNIGHPVEREFLVK